jgi:hypothetical protein
MAEGQFDFARWRDWLAAMAESLEREGLKTEFRAVEKFGRYVSLDVASARRAGSFCCWEYGPQADYDIMDAATHSFIVNSWMNSVDDKRFPALFDEFLALVLQAE